MSDTNMQIDAYEPDDVPSGLPLLIVAIVGGIAWGASAPIIWTGASPAVAVAILLAPIIAVAVSCDVFNLRNNSDEED